MPKIIVGQNSRLILQEGSVERNLYGLESSNDSLRTEAQDDGWIPLILPPEMILSNLVDGGLDVNDFNTFPRDWPLTDTELHLRYFGYFKASQVTFKGWLFYYFSDESSITPNAWRMVTTNLSPMPPGFPMGDKKGGAICC